MWSLFPSFGRRTELARTAERIARLEAQLAALQEEAQGLQELASHLDAERDLFHLALDRLRPGMATEALASALLELSFRPFDLVGFYLARALWEQDALDFPLYHEGGRLRLHPRRSLSVVPGLTGRALLDGRPLYIRTLEEAEAAGALFTEAERSSGLVPQTWYGVPVYARGAARPWGLAAFQCFQPDALPPTRRARLDALVHLLALALPSAV